MNQHIRRFLRIAVVLPCILILGCTKSEHLESKKVFRYNQAEALTSLDPAFARNQANIRVVCQLYNGLTTLNNTLQTEPDLAQNWEISGDGLIYTFHLRDDVFFMTVKYFEEVKEDD